MKFTDFNELQKVISTIPDIDLTRITKLTEIPDSVKELETKGVDTDIGKILFNGPHGELIYQFPNGKVSKIAVHISAIKEQHINGYRYHIFNCETLHKMKYDGKEEKYKSNSRTDGTFFMIMADRNNRVKKGFHSLQICTHCLKLYTKKYQGTPFDIQEYYASKINNLDIWSDMPYDMEVAPQVYIKEWNEISRNLKIKQNYRCERCNLNLSNHKQYLHAHHMDMNVRNNHSENIKILCISCHGREPNHIHVNSSPQWKEFMKLKQQGMITV